MIGEDIDQFLSLHLGQDAPRAGKEFGRFDDRMKRRSHC